MLFSSSSRRTLSPRLRTETPSIPPLHREGGGQVVGRLRHSAVGIGNLEQPRPDQIRRRHGALRIQTVRSLHRRTVYHTPETYPFCVAHHSVPCAPRSSTNDFSLPWSVLKALSRFVFIPSYPFPRLLRPGLRLKESPSLGHNPHRSAFGTAASPNQQRGEIFMYVHTYTYAVGRRTAVWDGIEISERDD
jgi:hypothetical protein